MFWFQVVAFAYDLLRLEEKLILKALRDRGVSVEILNVQRTPLTIDGYVGDVALIRPISMYRAAYAAAVFEACGAFTVNSSSTILLSGDKVLCYSALARNGLPIPNTVVALAGEAAEAALMEARLPVIDKPAIGSWGRMVSLITNREAAKLVVEHREAMASPQLKVHVIQEYVEKPGRDIRVLVLNGRALGAIYRIQENGDWRTNIARGAKAEKAPLTSEMEELAIKAARAVNGFFVSVDLIEHPDRGLLVLEVNGIPEFKGFMKATGLDVAKLLVEEVMEVYRR